jgi:predicted transposase YbfD/YdcC
MSNSTLPTIRLQDGSACNLNKRITKSSKTLLSFLESVPDPRRKQGRRYSVALVLFIVFVGLLRGSKDLKDVCLYAWYNQSFLAQYFILSHGIPNPTTISRLLQKLDPEDLVTVYLQFLEVLGITVGDTLSYDGKTIRAATGNDVIRHILSLFSHSTHLAVGQVGVSSKENEIPALERLLKQSSALIAGKLLLGDALHTQKATCKIILKQGADYLFVVKANQRKLRTQVYTELAVGSTETFVYKDTTRNRDITTTVTVLHSSQPNQELLSDLKRADHWDGVATIGRLHRTGTRIGKDGTVHQIDETIGVISSRKLSAKDVADHLHRHWCIENNLHWVKDVVFNEDKHTLRRGNAPQVMSYIRSMCISLCNALKLKSISDTIHHLDKSTELLQQFLYMAAVV